jgi:hypothetical protein
MNYEKHDCYVVDSVEASLAVGSFWRKSAALLTARTSSVMKAKSPEEVIVYESPETRAQLFEVISKYSLWDKSGNGVVDIPKFERLSITLKDGAKPGPVKVYPVRPQDKQLIDETFDKLHLQDKVK